MLRTVCDSGYSNCGHTNWCRACAEDALTVLLKIKRAFCMLRVLNNQSDIIL